MKTAQSSMNYITSNSKVFGGAPTITGTRIPLERVEKLVRKGYTETSLIEEFPNVDVQIIRRLLGDALKQARLSLDGT